MSHHIATICNISWSLSQSSELAQLQDLGVCFGLVCKLVAASIFIHIDLADDQNREALMMNLVGQIQTIGATIVIFDQF